MTLSMRERLLQDVMTRLTPGAMAAGARVLRSPPTGLPREQSPGLLVFPESDSIVSRPNDRVERQLVIRIVALARETGSDTPEVIADHLLVVAHAALFADVTLSDLCLGIKELDCEWDVEDADAMAVAIPARYQITYRTLTHDLTQKG
jgi:hypothetical protein